MLQAIFLLILGSLGSAAWMNLLLFVVKLSLPYSLLSIAMPLIGLAMIPFCISIMTQLGKSVPDIIIPAACVMGPFVLLTIMGVGASRNITIKQLAKLISRPKWTNPKLILEVSFKAYELREALIEGNIQHSSEPGAHLYEFRFYSEEDRLIASSILASLAK